MHFRYLAALMAAIGLAAPAELLAEDAESSPDAAQQEAPAPQASEQTAEQTPEDEAVQESGAQTKPTLGAELEPEQDVDEVLKETERQFEEASRELDQRARELEQESPVDPTSEASDIEDVLAPSSDPQVRAALEETERRFEEASRKIDESFEEAERDVPRDARDAARPSEYVEGEREEEGEAP